MEFHERYMPDKHTPMPDIHPKKTTCILLCILEVVCVFLSCHVLLLLVLVLLHEWTKVYDIMDYMHRHHAIMHLCEHVCVSKHLM